MILTESIENMHSLTDYMAWQYYVWKFINTNRFQTVISSARSRLLCCRYTIPFLVIPFDYPPFYVHFKRKFNNLPFANLMCKTTLSHLCLLLLLLLLVMLFSLIICAFSMSINMRMVSVASRRRKRRVGSVSFISITNSSSRSHSHISIFVCILCVWLLYDVASTWLSLYCHKCVMCSASCGMICLKV